MKYKRILLPLDGSSMAERALPHAAAQAECFGAELILLRVLEPFPYVRGMSLAALERMREETNEWVQDYLDRLSTALQERGIQVKTVIAEGPEFRKRLCFIAENQVDLIVICTRGRSGLSRWLMGSVADRVVRGATVPVLLVRGASEE